MATKMSKHVPFLTAGEHQLLALALTIPEGEVILPEDAASRRDIASLEQAEYLVLARDASKGDLGWRATSRLRAQPWAQTLLDNPLPD